MPLESLTLIGGQNGDVTITGTSSDKVSVRAILDVQAHGTGAAQELAGRIRLRADEIVGAVVPDLGTEEWVSISYVIELPRTTPIHVSTANGNVMLRGLSGNVEIATINGTIDLAAMSGVVSASGTNAQYRVQLDASTTETRFDLRTQNGSIEVLLADPRVTGIDLISERGEIRADEATLATLACNPSPAGCLGGRARLGDASLTRVLGRTVHGDITLRSLPGGAAAP